LSDAPDNRRLRIAPTARSQAAPDADPPIHVVLADDHAWIRRNQRLLLDGEADLHVIAEATDPRSALEQVNRHAAHGLGRRQEWSRLEAIAHLRRQAPETQIVVLTLDDDPVFATQVLRAGAVGFVAQGARGHRAARRRATRRARRAVRQPARRPHLAGPGAAAREDKLTGPELEALRLLATRPPIGADRQNGTHERAAGAGRARLTTTRSAVSPGPLRDLPRRRRETGGCREAAARIPSGVSPPFGRHPSHDHLPHLPSRAVRGCRSNGPVPCPWDVAGGLGHHPPAQRQWVMSTATPIAAEMVRRRGTDTPDQERTMVLHDLPTAPSGTPQPDRLEHRARRPGHVVPARRRDARSVETGLGTS